MVPGSASNHDPATPGDGAEEPPPDVSEGCLDRGSRRTPPEEGEKEIHRAEGMWWIFDKS